MTTPPATAAGTTHFGRPPSSPEGGFGAFLGGSGSVCGIIVSATSGVDDCGCAVTGGAANGSGVTGAGAGVAASTGGGVRFGSLVGGREGSGAM